MSCPFSQPVWLRGQRGAACGTGHRRTGSVGLQACQVLDIPPPPASQAQAGPRKAGSIKKGKGAGLRPAQ